MSDDDRPYKCKLCHRPFTREADVIGHLKSAHSIRGWREIEVSWVKVAGG